MNTIIFNEETKEFSVIYDSEFSVTDYLNKRSDNKTERYKIKKSAPLSKYRTKKDAEVAKLGRKLDSHDKSIAENTKRINQRLDYWNGVGERRLTNRKDKRATKSSNISKILDSKERQLNAKLSNQADIRRSGVTAKLKDIVEKKGANKTEIKKAKLALAKDILNK
jgi:hypothetical protein